MDQLANLGWEVYYESSLKFAEIPYNPVRPGSRTAVGQRLPDPDIGNMKKPRLVSAVCEMVGKEVGGIAQKGWLPLTLGGDHSLVRPQV